MQSLFPIFCLIISISFVVANFGIGQTQIEILPQAEASDSNSSFVITEKDIQLVKIDLLPSPIHVGDFISIKAVIANNSPYTIRTYTGCTSAISLEPLDNKIQKRESTRNCKGSNTIITLGPGQLGSISGPGETISYRALSSGDASVLVHLKYSQANSTVFHQITKGLTINIEAQTGALVTVEYQIPSWVKNTAGSWSKGQIDESDFVKGLQYLIQQGILKVPIDQSEFSKSAKIPSWVKNNAGWWSEGSIDDSEFVLGIQWLVTEKIIRV